jgi:hypothetical protein
VSTDFITVVPKGRWPSYRALNEAFERQGFPVEIVKSPRELSGDRVVLAPQSLGLKMMIEGQPVELEAGIDWPETNPGVIDDVNIDLAEIGSRFRAQPGDVVLDIDLRSSMEEWLAASYLMATLIREFGAHGHSVEENYHGTAEFADWLVHGAECRYDYGEEEAPRADQAAIQPVRAPFTSRLGDWVGLARWIIAILVIGLFAGQAWIKAQNAGKDPVQAVKDVFQ